MTNEKAREYFSAYSEGTLDAGLSHSFEAKLKVDATLRGEYDQFVSMLKELEALRFEEIEVPFDLNDRISAAIDKDIYDRKRAAKPSWTVWLKTLGFAGLAAAALYGAYLSINSVPSKGMAGAGALPPVNQSKPTVRTDIVEQIEYSKSGTGVKMYFRPSEAHHVEIKGGSEGVNAYTVDNQGWFNDLTNSQPTAAVFTIDVKGETEPTIVIVPGTERKPITAGNGSLVELAIAVADQFGVPVVVRSAQKDSELAWKVGEDAQKTLQATLNNPSFSVSVAGDVIHIESN